MDASRGLADAAAGPAHALPVYDEDTPRRFVLATLAWGLLGLFAGLYAAMELSWWPFNLGLPALTFGRLRPAHTNLMLFGFAANAIFAAVIYSTQRLCRTRSASDLLSGLHFWGWQAVVLLDVVGLAYGCTDAREYAEPTWLVDLLLAAVWVIFALNFFLTLARRREPHLYVSIWFYMASIIALAVLHVVNNLAVPATWTRAYPVYAGVQDALVQWWYGHNAVGFLLTTPFLGMMYYFLPKASLQPVYSYRLSVIHFWSLIFIYVWAGPHHLLYTALPDWTQTLGMVFSLMLIAPSWGGMLNGLLTLRGAWEKVRTDPILKFFVVGISFYGMSTFEGPMLAIKGVSALAHYTDWIVGHVHSGTLGWVGFIVFGSFYWLVPRLWKTELHSTKLATTHFWVATAGIVLYITSLWTAGLAQGLMWRSTTMEGTLTYPFIETVKMLQPFYVVRALGGALYLSGVVMLVYNVACTIRRGAVAPEPIPLRAAERALPHERGAEPVWRHGEAGDPIGAGGGSAGDAGGAVPTGLLDRLEVRGLAMALLAALLISIGGLVEIVPLFLVSASVPPLSVVKPYTPLEQEGRDLYLREGCYLCHSQMIRPFRDETERYGEYSKAGEFVYDHPFQWGSKRTGPDLQREGGKRDDAWQYRHVVDPREMSPGSIMPRYPWLADHVLDMSATASKMQALRRVGVPYTDAEIGACATRLHEQAVGITASLQLGGVSEAMPDREIVALIAYLQRLGSDLRKSRLATEAPAMSPAPAPAATGRGR